MKKKILIIDDDANLLKILDTALKQEGFEILTAADGQRGLRAAFSSHPDLIILDVMMPGMDGFEVCQRLLELTDLPVIMLTAVSATKDVVKGLSTGAADYITKPFKMDELIARVRAALRHKDSPGSASSAAVLAHGNLTIDFARHKVIVHGKPVDLTPTEFRLLSYLVRNRGRVTPHRTLLVEVWGPEYSNQIDYLHLYVRYLRQKIERDPAKPEIIKTERGVGYYLEDAGSNGG
jgi:two-component system, OmpR family, KDP operon response regulator KdpE